MKRDEVEEFLRRAAARRAQADAQRRAKQQRVAQQGQQPPPPQRVPPSRLTERLEPEDVVLLEPVQAEVVQPHTLSRQSSLQAADERRRDGSRQIGNRPPQFAQQVEMADDNMEAHLHQVFDHKLGRLRKDAIAEGPPPPVAAPGDTRVSEAAASIANMLRSPANLRNAIILNEIMTPPRHLW